MDGGSIHMSGHPVQPPSLSGGYWRTRGNHGGREIPLLIRSSMQVALQRPLEIVQHELRIQVLKSKGWDNGKRASEGWT